MKFFLISDNIDTQLGMRLTGVEGVVVHTKKEVEEALHKAVNDKEIGIILMTKELISLCSETVYELKLTQKQPLIVEIPDRHATSKISETISKYVQEAVGVKL
ncbi:MAG: ATP synthase subunit F [Clostridiales bacterium]|nr:ATP synthase subunit F [Clostridiales bacterium]